MGASNQFQYIINAKLQLSAGSLSSLVNDIRAMDKDIKAEFEKAGASVKVPLTADPNIEKLQKGVKKIVEGYNNGQVPTIKIQIAPDEQSIGKLQRRIAEVKKQLNSLSDEQARVSVNTSLVVGRNEGEEIQKQVEGIKPTIEVKVIANKDSIKEMQAQIEAVKAEIQASVKAVQNAPEGMNIIGHHRGRRPTNSVGNTSNSARRNPRINAELDNQKKSIQNDIITSQGIVKSLQDEMKLELSVAQIQKRIQSIRDAREKGTPKVQLRNAKGHFAGSVTSDQYDTEIKSLEDALKKHEQIEKLQKELSDKEERLAKLQQESATRRFRITRPQPVQTWYDDAPLPTPRQVSQANRSAQNRQYQANKKLEAKRIGNVDNAWDLAWNEYNSRGRISDIDKAFTQANRINNAINKRNTNPMQAEIDRVHRQAERYNRVWDAKQLAVKNSPWDGYTQSDMDRFQQQALRDERKRQAQQYEMQKRIQQSRIHDPQQAYWMAYNEFGPNLNRISNPFTAYTQATRINNNINRQQQADNKKANKAQSVNQKMYDAQNHIRRWGVNGEHSAQSMIDALKDPNVSLADSKVILKNLNDYQAQQARATGMNFQKSYPIKYLDEGGNLHEVNSMVYQYTKLGEIIEKSDKGFMAMMDHITSRVGVFNVLEGGIVLVTEALASSIEEMVQFNQQLAEIQSTTQNLNNTGLKPFYQTAGGTNQLQSQIQSNAFNIGKQFGVDTLNTVMPIEQAVTARPDLTGSNGKYDATKQNEIVKNIMQFSAISTGGKEDEETVNELTNDLLTLYQANQTHNSKGYMGDMSNMLDYMSAMHSYGVNTTGITNAMAELAPETLSQGINSNQAMAMMGAFSLSNAGGKSEDVENIGKTFYNSIMHANTNTHLKDTLSEYMGINLDANPMSTPDLINEIIKKIPSLGDNEVAKQQLAMALSSSGGGGSQSKAMTPLMVKFLEGTQSETYDKFMQMSGDGSTNGAMDNAWGPYSKTLKTDIQQLVQSFKQLAQLLGQLGVGDFFGATIKGLTGVLNVVDSILGELQKLSAFFQDNHIFDFSKFTTSALMFLGTMKMIQKFFNGKQWGGYVGSYLASKNPWGYSMGIKQNSPLNAVGTVASTGGVVQTAEAVAPSALPFAPVVSKAENTINPQEMNQIERSISNKNINSALSNVLTFTTADMMVNDFKNNPATSRLLTNMNTKVIPQSASEMNITGIPTASRSFTQNVAKTAEYDAMSTGRKAFSATGVGNFMSEALFLGQIKGGALKTGGSTFIEGLVSGFKGLMPIIMDFGLLMTRLTVIGGALFLAFEGVKLVADEIAKEKLQQQKQTEDNVSNLQKQAQKDPNVAKKIQSNVSDLINYSKGNQHTLATNPIEQKYGVRTPEQNKGEANIEYLKQYGIQYHKSLTGKSDYLTYLDPNTKKTQTYHMGNTKEQKQFNDFLNNGIKSDTQKIADQWKVNTSYLGDYGNQLKAVSTLTTNLAENMKQVDSAVKGIDATFGGIQSSDALQQKITVTQKGIDSTSSKLGQIDTVMGKMSSNKDKVNTQYDSQRSKIIDSGVSESKISDMETKIMVARANGDDPNAVINGFSKDPKMQDLAKAFNTLQDFTNAFNGTNDNFLSLKDQYSQMIEQQKQYQAQLAVTKLGIDSMNASLQQLNGIASASKALVDMNQNILNTGDNSAQIGALGSSMQVSSAQMDNMLSQQSTLQSAMDKIKSANPNQDFSLNALYNPQGQVSPEQMAYKSMYEQQQQMTQNIANQSSAMYQQVQQLRDLVLNSTEYADSWARIQQTVQDVKDAIKSTNDFQYQMASVNDNSLTTAGITGQKLSAVKQQQYQALRDSSIQVNTKLTTDQASFNNDISNLNKAWTQIMSEEGQNFNDNMVKPLTGIVGNFGSAVADFGKDVSANNTNMQNAISQMNNAVSQAQQASLNSSSQSSTGSFGAVTNTGQTIQGGQFSEKNYDAEMSPYAGGEYQGNVGMFVQAGAKYGVPPELLLAIAMSENSGHSNILSNSNNVGNIKATGSSPEWDAGSYEGYRAYSSLQQGINDLARLISQKISDGYNTIPLINKHYAEDPNWMNNVASFMAKMTGTSASTWLGDATVSGGFNIGGSSSSGSSGGGGGGGGGSYTIQSGDTLSGIASRYGTTVDAIASANGISNPNRISAGQTITIPGQGGGSSSSASAGGGGGTNGMFGWFNSVLNNTSAMHYVWGGAHTEESWNQFISKAAADCSGLVEQVYKQFAGINLGTTTAQGIYSDNNGGTPVSRSQLQAGDLVFFGGGTSDISHVGVYAGNNQMYTIDHDGMPVTKENLWSDYVAGKHFNISSGAIAGSPQASAPSPIDQLVQATNSYQQSIQAEIASVGQTIPALQQQIHDNTGKAIVDGLASGEPMGTSALIAQYDSLQQARQDIGAQMINNHDQIDALNAKHDSIVDQMNAAYNAGDAPSYNEYHAQLAYTDDLIRALQDNSAQLKALDDTYKAQQSNDPRFNISTAQGAIAGGINTLRLFNDRNQTYTIDYLRVANELSTMQSQYMTHQKEATMLKGVFDNWGQQTGQYQVIQNLANKDQQNLYYTQLKNITQSLNSFAQGTQQWYTALQTTVAVQKQILDLEQQRLADAQSNYNNTGTGVGDYIEQRAYTQSRDYTNESTGLQNAINTYKNGSTGLANNGYGIQMPSWGNDQNGQNSALAMQQYLLNKFGYDSSVVNADGGWTVRGSATMSQDQANSIFNDIYGTKIGAGWVTGGGYGLQMPSWYGSGSSDGASATQKYIQDTFGYSMQMKAVQDQNGSGYTLVGQDNLTQQNAEDIMNAIMGKYIGAGWVKTPHMYDNSNSYGLSTKNFSDENGQDAQNAQHYMGLITGAHPTWVQDQQGGGHWNATNLTNQQATNLDGLLKEFGYSDNNKITTSMDFNQQLANLQIIADTHNKMTQQMTDYKQAVTDAFKAGALSIDDYISKLNQLRDVQTEQKDNAVNMIGNIQSGFSSALSDALTQGMQGSINSPLDFMNSIKSTLSSSISGQLTNTLLNNTGLQDVMNKISSSVAQASTSGDPNAIVNMFNNNDFGKQMQDAIAPFLPMIQQLVGSTKGIFTILKDQVYNAPSGFKIDNYMNEVASKVGYQGIKNMNPNVNSVGSPILNFSSGTIQTTAPSQTPTGLPTGTSIPTNGTTGQTGTGAPENTTGNGTPAPSAEAYNGAPDISSKPWQSSAPSAPPPPPPPAPAPAPAPSSSGTKHTSSALYFRSSPSYGNNIMSTIPRGAGVSYYGIVSGWAKVGYNGRTGYVGPRYLYHTGGIAGVTNFASGQGLKPNELSAILQKSETIFQPKQLDDLVNGAMRAGAIKSNSGGEINVNVTVNFSGDTSDKGTIEQTVNTAVQKALQEFKKTARLNNLSWKGTSY